jgi:NADPH:quinone reductase-like Zn-dependent oxidoreductase
MGDLLLVNGANGGVGTAAGQLGRATGARVFGTVRSDAARERIAELGLEPLDPSAFVEPLRALGGADIVLELVGAPNLSADFEALAVKGRVVVVGTGAGAEADFSLRALMSKRARLLGTVLRARPLEEKAAAVQAFAHEVVPHLAGGRVKPVVDRVFAAADAAEAFDYMARPGKFGKVLLAF